MFPCKHLKHLWLALLRKGGEIDCCGGGSVGVFRCAYVEEGFLCRYFIRCILVEWSVLSTEEPFSLSEVLTLSSPNRRGGSGLVSLMWICALQCGCFVLLMGALIWSSAWDDAEFSCLCDA